MKEPIYITGHLHPDTDSIASAIGYAFYKRATGVASVPCRLGEVNAETQYLLNRFGFETPQLLEDARKSLAEIELDPPISIREDATIWEAVAKMKEKNCPSLVVVNEKEEMMGIVSRSDLSTLSLADTADAIELVKVTSTEDICKTVNGTLIYSSAFPHMNGKISIIALSERKLDNYDVTDRIVIIGSDKESMLNLIERGAGMLIAVWTDEIDDEVIQKAKEKQCSIIISGHGSMNTSRYIYFAPRVSLIMKKDIIAFRTTDIAENVGKKLMQTRFRQYPVMDENNHLAGYVSRYHIMNSRNKRIILVDHNEFSQSVKAIEKAEVLEVLDHHRINDFMTSRPVAFRSEIVGSTATIVATIFRENQIPLPSNLAGLLLGAVLSDTMNLHSPTTTQKDRTIANILAALADLDLEEFAEDMFNAQAADLNEPLSALIHKDIKYYELQNQKIMIGQVIVRNTNDIIARKEETENTVRQYGESHDLDFILVAFTSVIENGSILFYGGKDEDFADEVLSSDEKQHMFCDGLLSRKLQILPKVLDASQK